MCNFFKGMSSKQCHDSVCFLMPTFLLVQDVLKASKKPAKATVTQSAVKKSKV